MYWTKRANQFKQDIDHVKKQIESTTDESDLIRLKSLKTFLTNEWMICLEGVEAFKENDTAA